MSDTHELVFRSRNDVFFHTMLSEVDSLQKRMENASEMQQKCIEKAMEDMAKMQKEFLDTAKFYITETSKCSGNLTGSAYEIVKNARKGLGEVANDAKSFVLQDLSNAAIEAVKKSADEVAQLILAKPVKIVETTNERFRTVAQEFQKSIDSSRRKLNMHWSKLFAICSLITLFSTTLTIYSYRLLETRFPIRTAEESEAVKAGHILLRSWSGLDEKTRSMILTNGASSPLSPALKK